MTDPVFQSRAELVAWAKSEIDKAKFAAACAHDVKSAGGIYVAMTSHIRRVTAAHDQKED